MIGFGDARSTNAPIGPALSSVMVAMALDPAATPAPTRVLAGLGRRRGVRRGERRLLRLARRPPPATGRSWPWPPPPTARATGWRPWTAGSSRSGTPASTGRWARSTLNQPVVGWPPPRTGRGYWLVAVRRRDLLLRRRRASTDRWAAPPWPRRSPAWPPPPTASGYWMVAADGGIFTFGDAPFYGSDGREPLNDPVVGMVASPHDVGLPDGVHRRRDLRLRVHQLLRVTGRRLRGRPGQRPPGGRHRPDPGRPGLLAAGAGRLVLLVHQPPSPSPSRHRLGHRGHRQQPGHQRPGPGQFCNPYGPCEEWCALFATWVWEQAGVPIPSYPFTGSIYDWAAANAAVLPPPRRRSPAMPCSTGPGRPRRPPRSMWAWSPRPGRTGPS